MEKNFDYELAYLMYKQVKYELELWGIDKVAKSFTECGYRSNGKTNFYGDDYGTWVFLIKKDDEWYASGEVDIMGDDGTIDTLFINSTKDIEERIIKFKDYDNYDLMNILEMIRRDDND